MSTIEIFYSLTVVAEIVFVTHIGHISRDKSRRKKLLTKHKAKHGKFAFDVYSKIYSVRFLHATAIASAGWTLLITGNILRWNQGHNSSALLIMSGVGMVILIVGGSMQSSVLRGDYIE